MAQGITMSNNEGVILYPLTVTSQVKVDATKTLDVYLEEREDEIDSTIATTIGNKVEEVINEGTFATKAYVDAQVAVPIASETEYGKVELATPEDVTAVEADGSAVNNAAKAVTPYTLKEYIASKGFATNSDISDALASAKPAIFFQAAQPAGGKDGDIWIIP